MHRQRRETCSKLRQHGAAQGLLLWLDMGRAGPTQPFAPEELAKLTAASSNKFDSRPTSKLSREEVLRLVSESRPSAAASGSPSAAGSSPFAAFGERMTVKHAVDATSNEVEADAADAYVAPAIPDVPTVVARPTPRASSAGIRMLVLVGLLVAIAAVVTTFVY